MTAARAGTRLTGITYTVTRGASGPGDGHTLPESENLTDTTPSDPASPTDAENNDNDGLARSSAGNDVVTIRITADSDYCSKDNNYPTTVKTSAIVASISDTTDQVVPTIVKADGKAVADGDAVASTSFTVVCPAASANMGTELVPDNPFPTDR